jgi:alanyl-tRNA synthetase
MANGEAPPGSRATRRLYFEDAYQREFEAVVVESLELDEKPAVVLDQTCFYPESGGQPPDRGILDGAQVSDVREEGERIIHVLDGIITAPRIRGAIDWKRRFDHMQQHSGQHILSQSFIEILDGETRSFHLGELASTLEIGLKEISGTDLDRVEARANGVVFEDRQIKTSFVPGDKISTVPLRRPPKKEGLIRVVEVEGFDYSACGGTHCRRTGEVGLIKVTGWERIRGNLRFEFLCGRRALEDYGWKNLTLAALSQKLSVHGRDIPNWADKLLRENKNSRKSLRQLRERLAAFEAREVIAAANGRVIRNIWSEKSPEEGRLLALNVIRSGEYAVLFGLREEANDRLILASSEKLGLDMREIASSVLSRIKGKGGGSATLVEIVAEKSENLEELLAAAVEDVNQRLRARA